MTLDEDMLVLSGVPLFRGFSREQLRLLAFGAEAISLPAGRKLYTQGAPADCAYIIATGEVVLYWENGNQHEVVSVERRGAILGQLALIAQSERLTGAAAKNDTRVIRLSRSMFLKILTEFPELAENLHQQITADLEQMLERMTTVITRLAE